MAPVLMTLNDIEGHSPVAGFFKCNPSNICAVFYQILTDSALARSLSHSWALIFMTEVALLWKKDYLRKTACVWLCGHDAAFVND